MPRGCRFIILAIAGLILVGANPPSQNAGGQTTTTQGNNSANKEESVASGISRISEALEAQNAQTDPYEKERNEREIRDLEAQENSAYWAESMFWATVAALILSFIGIGLVYTTFHETRRSNVLSKAHQRARMEIKLEVRDLNQGLLVLALRGENIGGSVAWDLSVRVHMSEIAINPYGILEAPSHRHIVKPGEVVAITVMTSPVPYPQPFFVGGCATYRCIFGDNHESWFCFHVMPGENRTPLGQYIKGKSPLARIDMGKGIEWPDDT
jgi:hypothetical protein